MAFHNDSIYWVEVEKIVPNPFQPRREFNTDALKELSESIRMYGILQPLTVSRKEVQREDGTFYTEYELIAGERRLRASKLAGVVQVPVIIRDGEQSEQEKLELAIIENLQREDLSAVDRALAFRQLADVFGLSHGQVAVKVGRSREYVSNSIRLLGLPEYVLDALRKGDLSEGHARTLLTLNDRPEEQEVLFREILLKKLSVREVERIVRTIATDKVRKKTLDAMDVDLLAIEREFTETLGTRVQILKTDFGGKLTIDYFSISDLEQMLERMKAEAAVPFQQVPDGSAVESARLSEATPLTVTPTPVPDPVVAASTSLAATVDPAPVPSQSEVIPDVPSVSPAVMSTPPSPAASTVPETPAPAAKPVSALASALQRALGGASISVPQSAAPVAAHSVEATPPPVVKAPETLQEKMVLAEPPQVVAPTPVVTPSSSLPTPADTQNNVVVDEDDLYSIKNFTV